MLKFDAITLSKNITARREHLGMSIKDLAQRTGIPAKRIKAIEARERESRILHHWRGLLGHWESQ